MELLTLLKNFLVFKLLTLYYSLQVLLLFAFNYVKNPFADPFAQKLRLEPPPPLTDPKYGVHKYIKVNNTKLHYVESGDPSKPLMIFVHGFPEFWYSWRHQIVEFNKNYWCIAVDMRGIGDSERPDGVSSYKLDLLVEDLRDLVRKLGREKCILVAHDWGGLIACKFRDIHYDALDAIIVLASASLESFHNQICINPAQRKMSWYVFFYQMPCLPERFLQMNNLKLFEKLMLDPTKDTVTEKDLECYKYWFGKSHALTSAINYYRANLVYTMPEKKRCERNIPFLAAHASGDAYLSHSLLDVMKEEYAHIETAIVEDCRHFLIQEEPAKVNKLIKDFLSKHNI